MNKDRQASVVRTVWPWRGESVKAGGSQGPSLLFSMATMAVGLGVAAAFYSMGHPRMAVVVGTIACAMFLLSRFAPAAFRRVESWLARFSSLVGRLVTGLLLVPCYLLFFTFGRLVQVVTGKDPMARGLEPDRESYWQDKTVDNDPEHYTRQF